MSKEKSLRILSAVRFPVILCSSITLFRHRDRVSYYTVTGTLSYFCYSILHRLIGQELRDKFNK